MEKNFRLYVKRIFCLIIIMGQLVILAGCLSNSTEDSSEENPHAGKNWQSQKWDLFNTVSYIYSYKGESQESFSENVTVAWEMLTEYHRLFDIYYEYSGVVNLCTINKNAGNEAMTVDRKLIDFLLYAKEIYSTTKGETNVMLGPVLKQWHEARNSAQPYVPAMEDLQVANAYCGIDLLEIDSVNNTVRIKDSNGSIDVGALGKGYATEKVAQYLESIGCTSYVLNIGGNIRIIGAKPDGNGWKTGITNPFGSGYAMFINIKDIACVTSGDYERYFMYEGKKYHHIIDKDTLMPAQYFTSVTILTKDSGLADALSTALFSMPYEEGRSLIESLEGTEAIWIFYDNTIKYTTGVTPIE